MSNNAAQAGTLPQTSRWSRSRSSKWNIWRPPIQTLEDILPLSPLQEGLLFHALYDRNALDAYGVQIGNGV